MERERPSLISPTPTELAMPEGKVYSFDFAEFPHLLEGIGTRMTIPRRHLYGTQEVTDYSERKRKAIEKAFRQDGEAVLEQHPIVVCAIPRVDTTMLVIIDGHHRARYSGKFEINDIPSLVISPQEYLDARSAYAAAKGEKVLPLTVEELEHRFVHDASVATASFLSRMPEMKEPVDVPVSSLHELAMLFYAEKGGEHIIYERTPALTV